MKIVMGMLLLLGLSGCTENDILSKMASEWGGGRGRPRPEKTCRRCGTELSQRKKCLNMTCPFNDTLQDDLCKDEQDASKEIDEAYSKVKDHSDVAEKYRAKNMSSRPWGIHWGCLGCRTPTSRWIKVISISGEEYQGPFMCCPECEQRVAGIVEYAREKSKRR